MKLLIIKADTNDADYVHSIYEFKNTLEDSHRFTRLCRAFSHLKASQPSAWYGISWETGECGSEGGPYEMYKDLLSEEEIGLIEGYVPHGEFGIHTITSVTAYDIENKETII